MIFNKNGTGATEVKDLMGFTYASINFKNLSPYIEFPERDIINNIVGQTLFTAVQAHYDSANYKATPIAMVPTPPGESGPAKIIREALNAANAVLNAKYALLDSLVLKLQSPIIRHALRMYMPSSDVQHTEAGRSITVTETQKPAFEWQVEKDNANMLDLAHRAEELLIEFLFLNKNSVPLDTLWKDTDAAKALTSGFINSAVEFSKIFFINNSKRVFLAVSPIMQEKLRDIIQPGFLAADYDTIITAIQAGSVTGETKTMLDKASVPLAYYTMADALKQFSVEILPNGVFQNYYTNAVSSKAIANSTDRLGLSAFIERKADIEFKKLQEFLLKRSTITSGETYEPEVLTDRMDSDNLFFRP